MGANSKIEWTTHTFNPWRGCAKVSAGCANCYAEAMSGRNPKVLGEWGPDARRAPASENYWRQPIAWNKAAEKAGERRRVFCASLADVFEERLDLEPSRRRLFELIEKTTSLDWLLLTKRPAFAAGWLEAHYEKTDAAPLPNVWLGTSVEDQERADERIPELLAAPAAVRFLSCEPLLGPLDFVMAAGNTSFDGGGDGFPGDRTFDWVIVGGESGPNARPMHPDWARWIRDQCVRAGVAFHFKQWGAFNERGERVGKRVAGRELDGRTWGEIPEVRP